MVLQDQKVSDKCVTVDQIKELKTVTHMWTRTDFHRQPGGRSILSKEEETRAEA